MSEPGGRRPGRPGYDQETVLRRAVQLFDERGYDATSMGDLAADLGLSKSTLYHHVPSKEHLLQQAVDEGLDELAAVIDAVERGDGSAADRLRRVVHDSVVVLVEHLPAVTLLLRVRGNSDLEQAALRRRRELDDRLAALVRAAIAEGDLRTDLDPDLASRLVFGTVNSLTQWLRPGGRYDAETLATSLVTLVFEGLRGS